MSCAPGATSAVLDCIDNIYNVLVSTRLHSFQKKKFSPYCLRRFQCTTRDVSVLLPRQMQFACSLRNKRGIHLQTLFFPNTHRKQQTSPPQSYLGRTCRYPLRQRLDSPASCAIPTQMNPITQPRVRYIHTAMPRVSSQLCNEVTIGYNCPFPFDDHHPHLIHPSLNRPHSPTIPTASGSIQPFCHSTLSGQTDQPTHT